MNPIKLTKNCLKYVLSHLPHRNCILIESIPNLADNPKAVFDEMIKRGMNKKYKFIWLLHKNTKDLPKIKNVRYISNKNRFLLLYYRSVSKCIICGNRFVEPLSKKQPSFYLSHGTALKTVSKYYSVPHSIDYSLIAAPAVEDIMISALGMHKGKIFSIGYPRNDILTKTTLDVKKLLDTECNKVIVWYPTFRQHTNGPTTACKNALPIIHDADKAEKLNEWAKKNNSLIVLKPHFAQDLSYVKNLALTNIRFIDDNFFTSNNISSYEFVGACDALISDYSSIYFDYTLCDKPIGLVWEDVEEYKRSPGLIDNYEFYAKGGVKIYTLEDMQNFISDVASDIDRLKDERNEIKLISNYSDDGKNSERVVDFIVKEANL